MDQEWIRKRASFQPVHHGQRPLIILLITLRGLASENLDLVTHGWVGAEGVKTCTRHSGTKIWADQIRELRRATRVLLIPRQSVAQRLARQ